MSVLPSLRLRTPVLLKVLMSVALIGLPSVSVMYATPALTQKATKSIWRVFASKPGGFSLLMPGEPMESKSDGVTSYSVTRARESVTYTVSYVDFPVNPKQEKNGIDEAFTGIKEGITEEGGKIQSQQSIKIKDFPGEELRVSMPDGALTRVRSYIVGKRLYLVMVSTDNEKNLKRSLQGYLDSFQVKPEVVPEAMPEAAPPVQAEPQLPAAPTPMPEPEASPAPDPAPSVPEN